MLARSLALCVVTATLVGFAPRTADPVQLRYTLVEGSEKFRMSTTMKMSMDLPTGQPMEFSTTTEGETVVATSKVDAAKGTAAIEVTSKVTKMSSDSAMPMPMPNPADLPPSVQVGTIDALGNMKLGPKAGSANAAMANMGGLMNQVFVGFPAKPVELNEEWPLLVPKGPMTAREDQNLKVKLVGEETVDGLACWVIDTTGKMRVEPDLEELRKTMGGEAPPTQVDVKSTVDVSYRSYVDKATGHTVKMKGKAEIASKATVAELGVTMDQRGTIDIEMVRIKS